MNIRKHIPNTITCLSLVSGCIATVMALQDNYLWAAIWIIIAAVFDFLDGFAARLLKAYSPMGKELDSLSDMVSFGVAPGMIVFSMLGQASLPLGEIRRFIPFLASILLSPVCVLPNSILMSGRQLHLSVCRFRHMRYSGLRSDIHCPL